MRTCSQAAIGAAKSLEGENPLHDQLSVCLFTAQNRSHGPISVWGRVTPNLSGKGLRIAKNAVRFSGSIPEIPSGQQQCSEVGVRIPLSSTAISKIPIWRKTGVDRFSDSAIRSRWFKPVEPPSAGEQLRVSC
jgi:hypothetical protein